METERDGTGEAEVITNRPWESVELNQLTLTSGMALCLGFVVLADFLFYDHLIGWTVGFFGLLLLGTVVLWERRLPHSVPHVLVGVATASLFGLCVEHPTLRVVILSGLGLVTFAFVSRDGWQSSGLVWLRRWAAFGLIGWIQMPADLIFAAASHAQPQSAQELEADRQRMENLLLPLTLGTLFLALFGLANPIIGAWFGDAAQWARGLADHRPSLGQIALWILVALWVWALLRFRTETNSVPNTAEDSEVVLPREFPTPGLLLRCLVVCNAIFALQTGMDIRCLWGGGLPKGMTYAEYAHRGAYPLVVAALLAAGFVLAAFRRHASGRAWTWARGLVYLWLAQNIFLVFSAAWRLWLYVDAYSMTRLRVAAALWMLLVVCGLIWILARIAFRRSGTWLINVNMVTVLVVLYASCFVTFDGLIAQFNVDRSAELGGSGPELDIDYLEHLGPEALPALVRFTRTAGPGESRRDAREAVERLQVQLKDTLEDWRGWAYRRHRLATRYTGKVTLQPSEGFGSGSGGMLPVQTYSRRASAMVSRGSSPRSRSVR